MNHPKTNTYTFTLILSGVSEHDEALEDALFEAGCDDAVLYFRNSICYLDFDREATSFEEAVLSAIRDVEGAGIPAKPHRIEPADHVTSAEIARRLNRSRESVSQLITGKRGAGDFPRPVAGVTSNTLIWSWAEVASWFYANQKTDQFDMVERARFIRYCNEALGYRSNYQALEDMQKVMSRLNDFERMS